MYKVKPPRLTSLRDKNEITRQGYFTLAPSTTNSSRWQHQGMLNRSGKLRKGLGETQIQKNLIERRFLQKGETLNK